jgi:hypothetical protein
MSPRHPKTPPSALDEPVKVESTIAAEGADVEDDALTLDDVFGLLDRPRRSGRGYIAHCPAHVDRKSSLSAWEDEEGLPRLTCHTGCAEQDIWEAMGLTPPLYRWRVLATYQYVDEGGTPLYEVRRHRDKEFRPGTVSENGAFRCGIKGVRRVLYNLPDVLRSVHSGSTVFLVEGEKDADRLVAEGLTATTTAGGAKGWRSEYAASLTDADVVILPDNDQAGRKYAGAAAASLAGVAKRVRILTLPELPEKGDVSDWLDAGHSVDELRALADAPDAEPNLLPSAPRSKRPVEYCVVDGGIARRRHTSKGEELDRLCNFDARIIEQVRYDDGGDEPQRRYRIASVSFGQEVVVPAGDFDRLEWVPRSWGARAIIYPGYDARAHLPAAILVLSQEGLLERTVYTHLGWRKIDGELVYLHAGGALGRLGPVTDLSVEYDRALAEYRFPPVVHLPDAVRASLMMLRVAPPHIGYVLMAATYPHRSRTSWRFAAPCSSWGIRARASPRSAALRSHTSARPSGRQRTSRRTGVARQTAWRSSLTSRRTRSLPWTTSSPRAPKPMCSGLTRLQISFSAVRGIRPVGNA